jgi:hypothetical protein
MPFVMNAAKLAADRANIAWGHYQTNPSAFKYSKYRKDFEARTKREAGPVASKATPTAAPVAGKVGAIGATGATGTAGGSAVSAKALKALETAKAMYAPGGAYGKGLEAKLERGATKSVAAGTQSLVSSGLASTSMGAGLRKQYEEEVASPARADLESRRAQAISSLDVMGAQMEQGGYQATLGREFASSESAANRALTTSESALNRQFSVTQDKTSLSNQMMLTAMNRPTPQMSSFPTQSTYSAPSAPAAGQHIPTGVGGSGIGSFLENLKSSDIMSATDWNFGV